MTRLAGVIANVVQSGLFVTIFVGSGFAFGIPAPDPPSEAFVLDSTGSTYPFAMRLEGSMKRVGDTVEIRVRTGSIRSSIPPDLGEEGRATNVLVAFGVGQKSGDGWRMVNFSEPVVVSAEIGPGEFLPMTPHQFVVKGLAGMPLAEMWLTASLTVTQKLPGVPPGPLSSYACSTANLLGETPESRDRAKRMAENYAHAC
jgi:hypothetical protein